MPSKEKSFVNTEEIGDTIAHEYVREGLLNHLKALKECYLNPNDLFLIKDERNMNILHIAVVKVNAANIHGNTLAHYAANNNNSQIIKYLIKMGVKLKKKFNNYSSSPNMVCRSDSSDLFKALQELYEGDQNEEVHGDANLMVSTDDSLESGLSINVNSSTDWLIDAEKIKFLDLVSIGRRSHTHRAIYNNIKVFVTIPFRQNLGLIASEDLKSKCLCLRKLRHSNVAQIVGVSVDKPLICLLTYNREIGSLKNYIEKSDKCDLKKDIRILYEVASAMNYCHSQDIPVYHMDFSDSKVMFVLNESVEVRGFGYRSMPFNNNGSLGYDMIINNPEWVAPNIIENANYYESYEYDVYSFGILICKLLSRKQPYDDMNPMRLALNIVNKTSSVNIPENIPDEITRLINLCIDRRPENRPKFIYIVETLRNFIKFKYNEFDAPLISHTRGITWNNDIINSDTPLNRN